jgi:hypothetical protein
MMEKKPRPLTANEREALYNLIFSVALFFTAFLLLWQAPHIRKLDLLAFGFIFSAGFGVIYCWRGWDLLESERK